VLNETQTKLGDAFAAVQDIRRDPNFQSDPVFLRNTENQIAKQIKGLHLGGVGLLQREERDINVRLQAAGYDDVFRFDRFDADVAKVLAKIPLQ